MLTLAWITSALLALAYLFFGFLKLAKPMGLLPAAQGRAIGVVEILGAAGVILPVATGIAPILTPIAAAALALLQIFAIVFHVRRNETKQLPVNGLLLLIAVANTALWATLV